LNVDKGGDDTLFATADGVLKFDFGPGGRRRANVIPQTEIVQ
jgi:ribosomal protein L27